MITKIIIVDDHPVVRRGLQILLSLDPEIEIIAFAINGLEAVEKAYIFRPDVVLMDLNMPEMGGFEATKIIKQVQPAIRVIILTGEVIELVGPKLLAVGAEFCLNKNGDSTVLLQAIKG